MLSNTKDINNVETGLYLPEDLRYYIDNKRYVHKYGMFASALRASKIILTT